ncbi:MAG: DIP1984 family protein [Clostridia bacterium]|nr:DIP1984 family protein [Clostridia bacterium]MBQ5355556.1 DIP1984 family protein [Clostridia bacterium]
MKLAEALIERADLQKRLDQLEDRLQSNALVQDGEEPAEDPVALMAEYVTVSVSLEELITRINLTNAGTDVNGLTLTALIAKRDCLQKRVRAMRRFLGTASQTAMRSRGSEIIVKSTVPVRELQKSVDDLSKTLRETDTAIQAANWSTELL